MKFLKRFLPSQNQDGFFLKVLSTILAFVLVLITLVFLLIYGNLKRQSLNQAYTDEQENVVTVSYSASIMENVASSLLIQLNNDPEIRQLIYTDSLNGNLKSINAMSLFRSYTSASQWFDSAYVYNAKMDSVVYTYLSGGTYNLSFSSMDAFFDAEFLTALFDTSNHFDRPLLREVQNPKTRLPQKVFTYYLPVQSRSAAYDGLLVVNIRAERLMELCYGMNDNTHFDDERVNTLLSQISESGQRKGQCPLDGLNGKVFCTWNGEEDSRFVFISCIPQATVAQQADTLRMWLVLFYCSVLAVSVCSVLLLSWRFNKNYTSLQKQYQKTILQYRDNHNYIKDVLLRNFLTAKGDFPALEERFAENEIDLKNYRYYSLALVEMTALNSDYTKPKEGQQGLHPSLKEYQQPHFILQAILSQVISGKFRFEVVNVLQNRLLLILECSEASVLTNVLQTAASKYTGQQGHLLPGLYAAGISSMEAIPGEYQRLTQQFEMLYFYPASCGFLDVTVLLQRKCVGFDRIEALCNSLLAELKKQNFAQAAALLTAFFDEWFEPLSDARRTVEYLTKALSSYIYTFMDAYAVTMDFDVITFQNTISRCEHAQNVKAQFLSLIEDIRSVFAGVGQRSNYIDVILNMIQKNYQDPNLSADVLADEVALSAPYMNSVFKSATGSSVSGYLRQFRLKKAAGLLADTNLSVNEIAAQTGFGNASYFYTVFKKHYSITPNEYRVQHKNT